jgi:hypothetical protein
MASSGLERQPQLVIGRIVALPNTCQSNFGGRFHFSGKRVYQDLRITSGFPVTRPRSAANSKWSFRNSICQLTVADFAAISAFCNIWSNAARSNSFPVRNTLEIFVVL